MTLDDDTRQRISDLIAGNDIVLFMKGTRDAPQCGFSATVVRILDSYVPDYETLDVLAHPDIRDGIKAFSSWPTIPQLYVGGEFVGGCDIIQDLARSGELFETFALEPAPAVTPTLHITDAGARALRTVEAQHGGPGRDLHLDVNARFQTRLCMAPTEAADIRIESNGVTLLIDRLSAGRAEGVTLDAVETPDGPGFKIDNPNAPQPRTMTVTQLAKELESGERFELLDVRPPDEHARASIAAATLMTEQQAARLEALPRDTKIVFLCHHGLRSHATAEHYLTLGFSNVYNVEGGLDAWSQEVDPGVPRY